MQQAWKSCECYSEVGFGGPFLEPPPRKPSTGLGAQLSPSALPPWPLISPFWASASLLVRWG